MGREQLARAGLGAKMRGLSFFEVHAHFEIYGDAELVVGQFLDADNFGDVLAIHRVVPGSIGKGHEDAHALVVAGAPSVKVNAFF